MRIIDLLNKIANGEEVPKKIFYGEQYWINKYPNDYEGLGYGGCLLNNVCLNNLNDEVEIIEEDKKIEKIIPINILPSISGSEKKRKQFEQDSRIEQLFEKVNEIIDYLEDKKC